VTTPREEPFIGRPVISNQRCSNCGTRLIALPRWRKEGEGGWIEFDVGCSYGCPAGPARPELVPHENKFRFQR
jgi:hypothetical protein